MEVAARIGAALAMATLLLGQQPERTFRRYNEMAIAPDGKTFGLREETTVTGDRPRQSRAFHLVDRASGRSMWSQADIACFAFGKDEIYSVDYSGQFRAHNAATGAVVRQTALGRSSDVCAINSTGSVVALPNGVGGRITLVAVASGKTVLEVERFSTRVHSLQFSPDGRWLASGEFNRVARLWDVTTGVEQEAYGGHLSWVGALGFSGDSRCLVTSAYGGFRVWEATTGRLLQDIREPLAEGEPLAFAYSNDGRVLFAVPQKENAIESRPAPCPSTASLPSAMRVLTIGISEYADPRYNLPAARNDAAAVGSSLATRAGSMYRQTAPIRLYDATATRSGMLAALARLAAEAQPEDVAVIFFAGHGAADGKDFYLLPADASLTAPALAGISTGDLAKAITKVPARKKVLIVDACQSGGGMSKLAAAIPRTPGTSIVLIASSLASAMEIRRLGHGILTHVLLEAVGDQPFTAMSLMRVVAEAVRAESSKYFPARPQQVTTISTGEDFPLVARAAR